MILSTPLGTGGGLLLGLSHAQENEVLVLNGDTFFEVSLAQFHAQHQALQADASIALRRIAKNARYGEWCWIRKAWLPPSTLRETAAKV